jgi:disulfide oxidoreductase YuzD
MAKITHFTANTRPARCVMVLGTTSGAGKSWLTTALCRYYSNLGLKVAPFKAQNMSNNARVVEGIDGAWGEIGSAQYFQALAARAVPERAHEPALAQARGRHAQPGGAAGAGERRAHRAALARPQRKWCGRRLPPRWMRCAPRTTWW